MSQWRLEGMFAKCYILSRKEGESVHVHNDEKHSQATGVRQKCPSGVGGRDEHVDEVVENRLWVRDAEEIELERPPESGEEDPAAGACVRR